MNNLSQNMGSQFYRYVKKPKSHFDHDPITSCIKKQFLQSASKTIYKINRPKRRKLETEASFHKQKLYKTHINFKERKKVASSSELRKKPGAAKQFVVEKNKQKVHNFSVLNMRELIKKKDRIMKQEEKKMTNPFYKIMKQRKPYIKIERRVKTQISSQKEEEQMAIKPQILIDLQEKKDEDEGKEEQRMQSIEVKNFWVTGEKSILLQRKKSEQSPIRQKSDTKIYEEIKKYFEEKYGSKSQVKYS